MFRDLDAVAPASTILASNTSGFPIAALAGGHRPTRARDRLALGVARAGDALAEIVRTASTSEETIATVSDMAARVREAPDRRERHADAWGFVANRVYFAMIREAHRVVEEGVATRDQVDQLMIDCFRWPVGPFGMVRGATGGWS